jgi:hypothetical protein
MSDPHRDLTPVLQDARLLESLAAVEHERWSHWQRYLHSQCQRGSAGGPLERAGVHSFRRLG